jgi:hypothetical protein
VVDDTNYSLENVIPFEEDHIEPKRRGIKIYHYP